jgi:hypothetical protein
VRPSSKHASCPEGIDLPSYPVTRRSLVSAAVITGVLWVIFGIALSMGQLVFPLLPIASTVWLAFQVHNWRKHPSRGLQY